MLEKKRFLILIGLALALVLAIAGCGGNTSKTTPSPQASATSTSPVKAEPVKVVSLVDQVKNTQHYKFFAIQVAGKEKDANYDYEDTCVKCHSQVAILNDKNAKIADFFKGGKYENQTEGITCIVCHKFEGKDMISLRNKGWDSCGVCHTADKQVLKLGGEVHHPQLEMMKGVPIEGGTPMPTFKYSNMKDTFSCVDCHITNSQKHDFMVPGVKATYNPEGIVRTGTTLDYDQFASVFKQEKCVSCHADPKPTIDKMKAQQEEIGKKLEELRPIFDEWGKKVETMDKNDPKVKAYNNGKTYFWYVDADASKGAHNYALAKDCLQKAEAEFAKLK